jgi:arylesterase/paraoxonase
VGFFKILVDLFFLPYSSIVYFKNDTSRIVANNLLYANGIELNFKKDILFVSQTTDFSIVIFERNKINGDLKFFKKLNTNFGVDNLINVNDEIYVAGHPYLIFYNL